MPISFASVSGMLSPTSIATSEVFDPLPCEGVPPTLRESTTLPISVAAVGKRSTRGGARLNLLLRGYATPVVLHSLYTTEPGVPRMVDYLDTPSTLRVNNTP
jgi:hypothetical protein